MRELHLVTVLKAVVSPAEEAAAEPPPRLRGLKQYRKTPTSRV
jgi:hypothetical protein